MTKLFSLRLPETKVSRSGSDKNLFLAVIEDTDLLEQLVRQALSKENLTVKGAIHFRVIGGSLYADGQSSEINTTSPDFFFI
jgi:hypothetical protein